MVKVSEIQIVKNNVLAFLMFICTVSAYGSFEEECLKISNKYREKHGAPPLELDETIQKVAQEYANKLAETKTIKHSSNDKYGENLAFASGTNTKLSAMFAVDEWYNEIKDYDFKKPGFAKETGHFTALIWKNSKRMGCAYAKLPDKNTFYYVANYYPPGNVEGQFPDNVLPVKDGGKDGDASSCGFQKFSSACVFVVLLWHISKLLSTTF